MSSIDAATLLISPTRRSSAIVAAKRLSVNCVHRAEPHSVIIVGDPEARLAPPASARGLLGLGPLSVAEGLTFCSGLALHIAVARCLDASDYGRFALVVAFEVALMICMSGGLPQAMRRVVGADPRNLHEAMRWAIRVQLPIGIGIGASISIFAGGLAGFLGDPRLACPLCLLGVDVALRCGLVDSFINLLNGSRCFFEQSLVAGTLSVLRMCCVVGFVHVHGSLVSAVVGMILASFSATVLGYILIRRHCTTVHDRPEPGFRAKVITWAKLAPLYEIGFAGLTTCSLWTVKLVQHDPTMASNYAAAFMLSQPLCALGRILSGSTMAPLASLFASKRTSECRLLTTRGMACLIRILLPCCVVAIFYADGLFPLAYGNRYAAASSLLRFIVTGMATIVVMAFLGTVLGAAGHLRGRLMVVVALNLLAFSATRAAVASLGNGGAALSLLAIGSAGSLLLSWLVRGLIGRFFPWASLGRILLSTGPLVAIGLWLTPGRPPEASIVGLVLGLFSFAVLARATGEIGWPDGRSFRHRISYRVAGSCTRGERTMAYPPGSRQAGFTLIEILIVVAIVGVLIALALPAVQAAREASRRAQCLSNLRQHGIALQAYQSAAESFPIGCTTWNYAQAEVAPGWAWSSAILPQLEQSVIYSSLNMDLAVDASQNSTARSVSLASFNCPSDVRAGSFQASSLLLGVPVESATTSYAASHGTNSSGIGNGMFGVNKSIKVRDVKDGLSTTIALGERGCLPVQNAWSGALSDGRGDSQVLATTSAAAPAFDAAQPSSFFGPHAGVVQFLMCDGSAKGISTSINPAILQALSTRNGRETVGAADF